MCVKNNGDFDYVFIKLYSSASSAFDMSYSFVVFCGLFCRVCGVHIHHTNILFHEDCPGIFEFFFQAKVPEKYGSQEIQR